MSVDAGGASDPRCLQNISNEGHNFVYAGNLGGASVPKTEPPTSYLGMDAPRAPFCPDPADDDRWRDVLPLPFVSEKMEPNIFPALRSKRRAFRRYGNAKRVNGIISTLNEMAGFAANGGGSSSLTKAQDLAHQQLFSSVAHAPRSATHFSSREALYELLHCGLSSYGSEEEARSTVRSYNKCLVSLPETGAQVFSAEELLDDTGRGILQDPFHHLFSEDVSHAPRVKPYMDEVLKSNTSLYHDFIGDLWDKGMITFGQSKRALITPFFVTKKNGKLRLVLDCRATNGLFRPPPDIAMAAGYSFGQLALHKDRDSAGERRKLFTAQSDIKDYFYSIGMPEYLFPFFCLPPIRPAKLSGRIPELAGLEGSVADIYPQMKVVPMGWSWAMFFAQRIHQHQVMIGAGISHEQVLVDGRPPPMLDDGKSIVIPYADNLNVIGINKQDVQNIKDKAVARLRQVGFRVHEEEDASTTAKALGFIIDGDQLRVHPVPEKRDKVISVLRWLSQRPKVTGKCIERIVGHCIHFFMLKRELLSIFRSVYDFKTAHYSSPSRLWRTAADECRWAADLLWICESDLAKEWSGHATVSDACLTGTATCALNLNSLQAHSIGANRELWRYKGSTISIKARDVVQKLDPFCDVRTVFDPGLVNDPFQLNSEFQNVPYHISCSDEWKFQFSSRMKMKEHITILEGRATVQSIRHKCRSSQHFNKHHIHFGDNLGMVLAFDRGRAKSIPLLLCCRRAAAFSIACGCQFHHRWVPSEWNAADGPSRRWEQKAHGEKCSKRSTEKVISEIIYPTTAKAQSKALARVAKGLGHSGPQGRSSFGNTKLQTAVHESSQKVGSRQGPRGQETEETIQPLSREEIQQTDGTGSLCSKSSNPSRLSSSSHGVSRILQATSPENCNSFSGRPISDPVSELLLSRGAGRFRSKPVLRSSDGVLSNSGKDKFGQESASFEGLAKPGPGTTTYSVGLAFGEHYSLDTHAAQSTNCGSLHPDNVQHLHSSKRGLEASETGCGENFKLRASVGNQSQLLRRGRDLKSGYGRRKHPTGQSYDELSGPSSSSSKSRASKCSSLQPEVCRPDPLVEDRIDEPKTLRCFTN